MESQKDDLIFNYHCCSRITPLENEDSLSLIKTVRNNNIYLFNQKSRAQVSVFLGHAEIFFVNTNVREEMREISHAGTGLTRSQNSE